MALLLNVDHVAKSFGSTVALRNAFFQLQAAEIHALIGENGAGKSTLMKILAGVHRKDSGAIFLDGVEIHPSTPKEAQTLGIGTVFQELSLCPNLSIAENIYANREPSKFGLIRKKVLHERTENYLNEFGVSIPPDVLVGDLNIGQRQIVEILKAISINARVLILDEPTSSLEQTEVLNLFGLLRTLKENGTGIIFISHKLDEVFQISDRITVFRDGEHIVTCPRAETNEREIIRSMMGREIQQIFPSKKPVAGERRFEIKGYSYQNAFRDISFNVRRGEILGVAGLTGSGRSEVMQAIYGYRRKDSGDVFIDNKPVRIDQPYDAIRYGIMYSPEDRKTDGLFLNHSIVMNLTSTCLDECGKMFLLSKTKEHEIAGKLVKDLSIKVGDIESEMNSLSGGNQQKVLLAKCLVSNPELLIVDEPTRGIDIGSKVEIYHLLRDFADRGGSVVLISSELTEIIGMSDRVVVFKEGRIAGEIKSDFSESSIMQLMFKKSIN
jgi:ribose transport system ATP-binding protein